MALKTITYSGKSFDLSYEIINPLAKTDFIVLHGWGSNKNLMKQSFAKYLNNYRHIYIDLPGFGNSSTSVAMNSFDVAQIIDLFLEKINASKDIVLGHSFGGKIATLLKPKLLVLVATAGIVVPKPFKVKLKIALFKILKGLGLQKFRSYFVADDAKELSRSMYETFKIVINEDFSDEFIKITAPTMLFWGEDDTATPLFTAKKINSLIDTSTLKIYSGDHYFFMKESKNISKEIEKKFGSMV